MLSAKLLSYFFWFIPSFFFLDLKIDFLEMLKIHSSSIKQKLSAVCNILQAFKKRQNSANSFILFCMPVVAFKQSFPAFSLILTSLCMQYCFAMCMREGNYYILIKSYLFAMCGIFWD